MNQKTINKKIKIKGIGLHSGKESKVEIIPSDINTGINFIREDVSPNEQIKGLFYNVQNTMLATSIVHNGIEIKTIEHLLSALSGLHIDNAVIKVYGPEIPILDGSSKIFIEEILKAGIKIQEAKRKYLRIKKEVIVRQDDSYAKFTPYEGSKFSFGINYNNKAIDATPSEATFILKESNFIEEISNSRTFGFEKEIEHLKKEKLILGGSLDNAIVVTDNGILNEDGLRREDEFVKHKILDAIGDIYLSGYPILGAYDGYKSGHRLNNLLVRKLMTTDPDNFEIIEL
jgi:UDP-3-O-[3-hydroxymyristoyl] N-acetylglucosamine deacetylase